MIQMIKYIGGFFICLIGGLLLFILMIKFIGFIMEHENDEEDSKHD